MIFKIGIYEPISHDPDGNQSVQRESVPNWFERLVLGRTN